MIYDLHPTPLYKVNYKKYTGKQIPDDVINYSMNCDYGPNTGNQNSVNTNVLSEEIFSDVLKFIGEQVYHFAHNIYMYDESKIQFYITQSWLNMTKKDEFHHVHNHSNSIISGVFYIKVENTDGINFLDKTSNVFGTSKTISLPRKETQSPYNTEMFSLGVEEGDLLLFDSKIPHGVEKLKTELRISLSFNTFVKGQFGTEDTLTLLHI